MQTKSYHHVKNNSMLPLVGIVNIMKIKQYQIHEKMYRYRV
jgi:hypothetical protein